MDNTQKKEEGFEDTKGAIRIRTTTTTNTTNTNLLLSIMTPNILSRILPFTPEHISQNLVFDISLLFIFFTIELVVSYIDVSMVKCRHYSLRVTIDVRKTMVVLVIAEFFL